MELHTSNKISEESILLIGSSLEERLEVLSNLKAIIEEVDNGRAQGRILSIWQWYMEPVGIWDIFISKSQERKWIEPSFLLSQNKCGHMCILKGLIL